MANSQDPKIQTSRNEVFDVLDGEREHQRLRWGYRQPDGGFVEPVHSVCDYVLYMQHYLSKAITAAATSPGNSAALEELRKVVALGVACFEQNGIVSRGTGHSGPMGAIVNARDGMVAIPGTKH